MTRVDADLSAALARLADYRQLAMVNFAQAVLPSEAECQRVLTAAAKPVSATVLVADLPPERRPYVFRVLVWLVKLDLLRVVD